MLISVIVPTCNRNDLLSKCLDMLSPSAQTIEDAYEVIVTDDSEANLAKSLIQENYKWAKWIQGPKRGPAANRNAGAGQASGEWLVFIDDDVLPDKKLLDTYKNAIAQYRESLAFEGAILPDDWTLLEKDMSECPINTEGSCFWSANVCINASLFKQINGFDEGYLIAAQEDQQMKIDIETATSKKIRFLKECVVIHPVRFTTIFKQIRKINIASKNFCLYALKNKKLLGYSSFIGFASSQFKLHLINTLRLIKTGKMKNSLVALIWLIYGVPTNATNYLLMRNKIKG